MKFGPLLITLLLFAPPSEVLAQSGTGLAKGVVEDWSEVRAAGNRTALEAFIQRWPEEPLYAALARQILDTLPQTALAERKTPPVISPGPLALALPRITTLGPPGLPAPAMPVQRLPALAMATLLSAPEVLPSVDIVPPATGRDQAEAAMEFLQFTIDLQLRPETSLEDAINRYYTERISFYNNDWTRAQVINDKRGFFARWPERSYEFIPDKTVITCENDLCRIEAEMLFEARSPARQAVSAGRAQFSYIVNMRDIPLIQLESSTVLERF